MFNRTRRWKIAAVMVTSPMLALTLMSPVVAATGTATETMPEVTADTAPTSSTPNVGDCYNMTYAQQQRVAWPALPAVSCNSPHTVEVYATGTLPATATQDADTLVAYLETAGCTTTDAWESVNANTRKDGIVKNPLRIGNSFFTLTAPDGATKYACTTSVIEFNGAKQPSLQTLPKPLATLVKTSPETLGFCSTGSEADQMESRWSTVNCTKSGTWKVGSWVLLDKAFTKYPGAAAITSVMDKKCDPSASYTFPTEKDWNKGRTIGWCHVRQL